MRITSCCCCDEVDGSKVTKTKTTTSSTEDSSNRGAEARRPPAILVPRGRTLPSPDQSRVLIISPLQIVFRGRSNHSESAEATAG